MAETWPLTCNKCGTTLDEPLAGKRRGVPVHCPAPGCRASKKIPAAAFGGTARAQTQPKGTTPMPAVPARRTREVERARGPVAEFEPAVGPRLPTPEQVERFVGGFRRRPDVLEPTRVIGPDRAPAVEPAEFERRARLPVADRARQALSRALARAPRVDPLQPQGFRPCALCAEEDKRTPSGRWPAASFAIELADGAAGDVCRDHLAMALKAGYRLARAEPLAQPKPPRPG